MGYRDPVCQAMSGEIPDYDYDPLDLDSMLNIGIF